MKKISFSKTRVFLSSIFRLLVLFFLVLISVPSFAYYVKYYASAKVTASSGAETGTVAVYHENNYNRAAKSTSNNSTATHTDYESKISLTGSAPASLNQDFYYWAVPAQGYYFYGWSAKADGGNELGKGTESDKYRISQTVAAKGTEGAPTPAEDRFATFKPIIAFGAGQKNIELIKGVKDDAPFVSSKEITIDIYTNADFSAAASVDYLRLTKKQDANNVYVISILADYYGDVTVGDEFTITITTNVENAIHEVINVKIVEPSQVFLEPDEGGSYVVTQPGNKSTSVTEEEVVVDIFESDDFSFILNAQSDKGYRFERWEITSIGKANPTYIYDSVNVPITTSDEMIIKPKFVRSKYAMFAIKDGGSALYSDLDEAISASEATSKVVVTYISGELAPSSSGSTYTIPSGYTLLVPRGLDDGFSIDYAFPTGDLTAADFVSASTNVMFRKLILPSGSQLIVNGHLCVAAKVLRMSAFNTGTHRYGMIELQGNSYIQVNNGGKLHALGYITNPTDVEVSENNFSSVGRVIAMPGSTIYEPIHFADWRGGSALTGIEGMSDISKLLSLLINGEGGMIKNGKKVFPFSQYYVQNIEAPLILKSGAKERVSLAAEVISQDAIANEYFVTQNTNNDNKDAEGLFRLGTYTELVKYYDRKLDRQKYIFQKSAVTSETYVTYLNSLNVQMEVLSRTLNLNTKDYVLPIASNCDVIFKSGVRFVLPSGYKTAFLAGTKVAVQPGAEIEVNSEVIIYDNAQNSYKRVTANNDGTTSEKTLGYFSSGNDQLKRITYTPANSQGTSDATYKRTINNLEDATFVIDGVVNITSTGALYTTTDSISNPNSKDYGASIISNDGGKVIFASKKANGTTYQAYQGPGTEVVYLPINVTNAYLRNSDGTLVAGGQVAETGATYVYYATRNANNEIIGGEWTFPRAAITQPTKPDLDVTMPTQTSSGNLVCTITMPEGWSGTLTPKMFHVESSNPLFSVGEWNVQDNALTIPITYDVQNRRGTYSSSISITTTSQAVGFSITYSTTISATETYDADFSVDKESIVLDATMLTSDDEKIVISPTKDNVTTLWNHVDYKDNVIWDFELIQEGDEFGFEWGQNDKYLSDAKVMFKPKSHGNKTATLLLKASYIDESGNEDTNPKEVEIPIKATAKLVDNSLLLTNVRTMFVNNTTGVLLFDRLTNNVKPIAVTLDKEGIITATKQDDGNYLLTTGDVTGDVKITIRQEANDIYQGYDNEITIHVLPTVSWNWNVLYYGSTLNTDPVVVGEGIENWRIELVNDSESECDDYLQLSYNEELKKYNLSVSVPDVIPAEECQVWFNFIIGDEVTTKFSSVLSPARLLKLCVSTQEIYDAVTIGAERVSYSDSQVMFASKVGETSRWKFQFVGVPDYMTFIVEGENSWQVRQFDADGNANIIYNWVQLDNGVHTISLLPTTRSVEFVYGAGTSQGTLSSLCVDPLTLRAAKNIIYLPTGVAEDIKFYHINDEVAITKVGDVIINSQQKISRNGYNETVVSVSVNTPGEYAITADALVTTNIVSDVVPQGLPINLDEDNINRYYFIVDQASQVSWNPLSKQIIMETASGGNTERMVVFHFEGAPCVISFTSNIPIKREDWVIEESVDGKKDWFTAKSSEWKVSDDGKKVEQGLLYTSRYVRLKYIGARYEQFGINNLVIQGAPNVIVGLSDDDIANKLPTSSVDVVEVELNEDPGTASFVVRTINLENLLVRLNNTKDFELACGTHNTDVNGCISLSHSDYENALGINKVGDIVFTIDWIGTSIVNEGLIEIINPNNGNKVLAYVKLVGAKSDITLEDANTGIFTGVKNWEKFENPKNSSNDDTYAYYEYKQVDVSNAFLSNGSALFDYLFIYGETTTNDGSDNILAPTSTSGSNAKTPCYVYQKKDSDEDGVYDSYEFMHAIENVNVGAKVSPNIPHSVVANKDASDPNATSPLYINVNLDPDGKDELKVYITGFCPYASTGYDKYQEGVWYFRGGMGDKLHVYLEDCHIYSRNKTDNGAPFKERMHADNPKFSESYVCGSGGVFVFESTDRVAEMDENTPAFDVIFHTRGENVLKSHYGCFYDLLGKMRAFQVSSPIQIRLASDDYFNGSKATLTFDDIWPSYLLEDQVVNVRTNGFLSLQKQHNNAPSIDLGNKNTDVYFRGGQVELQNAQIVSTNYKTTLAISYRSGLMGGDDVGIRLAYGIGTDDASGGRVFFYDGTTTVIPMEVLPEYRQYYLMDNLLDESGNVVLDANNNPIESSFTSCLRCPKNTYVLGGSQCWLRSCQHVTSKGGAPTDGYQLLGQYMYEIDTEGSNSDVYHDDTKLVTVFEFPTEGSELETYYATANAHGALYENATYGTQSVTPASVVVSEDGEQVTKQVLYFWIPDVDESYPVDPEKDKLMSTWKACMTRIEATMLEKTGSVGGDTPIEMEEEVQYLLYCKIDEEIKEVITEVNNSGKLIYKAPVKFPMPVDGQVYGYISPSQVGTYDDPDKAEIQHYMLPKNDYEIAQKVYYVTTATADVWKTFTAPFDVEKIWVVETYPESILSEITAVGNEAPQREIVMKEQAKHNADFAAFFAVAMATGSIKSFDDIYADYIGWAKWKDSQTKDEAGNDVDPLYSGQGTYNLRGKYPLTHYDGTNLNVANFYLYQNTNDWETIDANASRFKTAWTLVPPISEGDVLMYQDETYALLFPYCQGCDIERDENGNPVFDPETKLPIPASEREYWDYWSGKFIIFESTMANSKRPHVIRGENYVGPFDLQGGNTVGDWIFDEHPTENDTYDTNTASLIGNSTLALMRTDRLDIFTYLESRSEEGFYPNVGRYDERKEALIAPTESFLIANVNVPINQVIKRITRDGRVVYGDNSNNGNQNGTSGGSIPTVGGGNDLFVTSIAGGINVAVAAPQNVRVLSSTGAVIYSGYIQTAVDIKLPTNGIYIVSGENEVQKILF